MAKATGHRGTVVAEAVRIAEVSLAGAAERGARAVRHLASRVELHLAARRAALDPATRDFVEQAKADVASGAVYERLAKQPELSELLREYGY